MTGLLRMLYLLHHIWSVIFLFWAPDVIRHKLRYGQKKMIGMILYKEQKEAEKKGLLGWHASCLQTLQRALSCRDYRILGPIWERGVLYESKVLTGTQQVPKHIFCISF